MSIWIYPVIGLLMVAVIGLAIWYLIKLIIYCYYRFVSGMKPDEIQKQITATDAAKPKMIWFYIVGVCIVGVYSGILIPVFAGKLFNPQAMVSATIFDAIFFALLWKRFKRSGWIGAIIGIAFAFVTAFLVGFFQGYLKATHHVG